MAGVKSGGSQLIIDRNPEKTFNTVVDENREEERGKERERDRERERESISLFIFAFSSFITLFCDPSMTKVDYGRVLPELIYSLETKIYFFHGKFAEICTVSEMRWRSIFAL